MTATVLQFPRPTRPKSNRVVNHQPCEVISLDDWRLRTMPRDDLDNLVVVHFQTEPQTAEGTAI